MPKSRNNDQSVLNDILSTMANEVLDVALVNQQLNQTLETGAQTQYCNWFPWKLRDRSRNEFVQLPSIQHNTPGSRYTDNQIDSVYFEQFLL